MTAVCAVITEMNDACTLSSLEAAVLGQGLAPEVEELIATAGYRYQNEREAEDLLWQADRLAPDHAAVLIALYRFYFYKGRLLDALAVAVRCLGKAMRDLALTGDWRTVRRLDARFGDVSAILPRFLLFSLKGYAYLNMRVDHLDEARVALAKLRELDDTDRMGWSVLEAVLHRREVGDDD